MTRERKPTNTSGHTTRTRDAALHRLGRVNRMLIAGSVVLTGLLTDVAAHAFPGKTAIKSGSATAAKAKSARGQARAHIGASSTSHDSSTSKTLRSPAQAPRATSESTTTKESTTAPESTSAKESTSAPESTSAKEATAAQESAQAKEATATQESSQAQKAAAPESTQTEAASTSQESSAPVVSGGS